MLLCIELAVHLQLQLLAVQLKHEAESDIVLLQTSTLCEVVKFVKQKAGSLMYHIQSA